MSTTVAYRLRVRNAADSGDALVLTSIAGGTNPYLTGAPVGDGQTLDPLKGAMQFGAFTVRAVDAVTGTDTRVVTALLADAGGRQQLLSRRAYVETSTDAGATWVVLMDGYVNNLQLSTALVWTFTVGESTRTEQRRKVFTVSESGAGYDFSRVTCLVGGPVKGGNWGPIASTEPWTWRVKSVGTGFVVLELVSAIMYDKQNKLFRLYTSNFPDDEVGRINQRAAQWFERLTTPYGTFPLESQGWFPTVVAEVYPKGSTTLSQFLNPITASQPTGGRSRNIGYDFLLGGGSRPTIRLAWTIGPPSVGDLFDLVVYPTRIGPDNPLHWEGHPVDFAASVYAAAGLAVDATSITTVTAALGADLWVRYRFTGPQTVGALLEAASFGPFGFAARRKGDGTRELITTRLRPATAPTETLDAAKGVDGKAVVYDATEASFVNWLIWKQQNFTNWTDPAQGERAADNVIVQPQTFEPDPDDAELAAELATYGQHDVTYDLPGGLVPKPGTLGEFSSRLLDPTRFVQATHRAIYDWYGRGREAAEPPVYRGAIAAGLGDFILVTLPHKPGADTGQSPISQRGTTRVAQVVRKTPGVGRDTFRLLDAGGPDQAALAPTFTIAKSTARPRNVATVTLTNGAALVAAGVQRVRVEYAIGSSPTSGTLVGTMDPAVDTTLDLPAVSAGLTVGARMRGETKGQAPTAYTAFQTVALDALPVPTSLTAGAGADDTETLLTWAVSDATLALIVRWKLAAETAYGNAVTLPPGSVQYTVRGLTPGASYDAEVSTVETAPYTGESTPATVSFTQGATVPTLNPPTNPAVFAGTPTPGGGATPDGSFGLEVTATEFPSEVVVEVALETAVGSGTFGSYSELGATPAVADGRTRVTGFAPNDGLLRKLRAYQHRDGATDSTTTTPLTVDPWGVTGTLPVSTDGGFLLVAADPSLPNSRALTGGTGLTFSDGGPGGNFTGDVAVALDDATDYDPTGKVDGDVPTWNVAAGKYLPAAPSGGGGGSLARASVTKTTGSLANLAVETGTVTLAKSGLMFKVVVDHFCRVRLYKTAAARTADASRAVGTDPNLVAGVITDLLFTSNTGLTLDVQVYEYENGDGSPTADIYYAIENRSGSTTAIAVTFTHIALET